MQDTSEVRAGIQQPQVSYVVKRCTKCREVKPLGAFSANRKVRIDGRTSVCKTCGVAYRADNADRIRENRKAYYINSRDKILAYVKEYSEKNSDRIREYQARYWAENRDQLSGYNKRYRTDNADRIAELSKEYRESHKEETRARGKAWREANADRIRDRVKEYTKAKNWLCNARNGRRRAAKLRATPAWADIEAIKRIYEAASKRTKDTGIPHEADHIVPLQSPIVCGLHCEANLEVITRKANLEKSNKWWPDMPDPEPRSKK